MIGSTRAQRKVSAALRARHSLEFAFAKIDYAEDVIKPTLKDLKALEATSEVEVTEADLISLLTTGTLTIEAGPEPDAGEGSTDGFGV